MIRLPLTLKVVIFDKNVMEANVLKAIIDIKPDVLASKVVQHPKDASNALHQEGYNSLFIDIFSCGVNTGVGFVEYTRKNHSIVPICLYSLSSLLKTMPGVNKYWIDRFNHYYRLNKDQVVQKLDDEIEYMLDNIAYELQFNMANLRTDEIERKTQSETASVEQTKEDYAELKELLDIYRKGLYHYLKQQALHGRADTPLNVANGINESRDNIRRIKGFLRNYGLVIEDHPLDV